MCKSLRQFVIVTTLQSHTAVSRIIPPSLSIVPFMYRVVLLDEEDVGLQADKLKMENLELRQTGTLPDPRLKET